MAIKRRFDANLRRQNKLALIIGNSDYVCINKLTNPTNDAKQLSSLLKRIGFGNAKAQLNQTCVDMKHRSIDFQHLIHPNDIVLFYFAGHGVQWEDQNYLMPIDIPNINKLDDDKKGDCLKMNAINAQDILNQITDRKPYVTIFLLDCCREYVLQNRNLKTRSINENNSKSGGLAAMHKAGSLIAFACAPGTVVDDRPNEENSLFVKHLLKHLATPNEDIVNIARDVTHGVMEDSHEEQIPFLCVQLRHKNVYLCEAQSKKYFFE
ncbi:unnamed protein product [Rotaria sp. Silwood1]|nr:unnamed protein product [Rotaria sp. Silwood1]